MGQYFVIFNIEKRQRARNGGLLKFGEWFPSGGAVILTQLLLRDVTVMFPDDPFEGQWRPAIKADPTKTGISDLSLELECAIFNEIDTPSDVFAVCLASSHLWIVGLPRFKEMLGAQAHLGYRTGWAGDRIICLGDCTEDLPKGMITEAELADLGCGPEADLYSALDEECKGFRNHPPFEWNRLDFPPRDMWSCSDALADAFEEWINPYGTLRVHGDPEVPWVLRNLSKKVYVRADVLAIRPEDVCGPDVAGMSFGSLVASRICWSSDRSMAMYYAKDHDLHRGVWAGDRFDIVQISEVDDNWTDVSLEAKKELGSIWESEFGENWEKEVVKLGL